MTITKRGNVKVRQMTSDDVLRPNGILRWRTLDCLNRQDGIGRKWNMTKAETSVINLWKSLTTTFDLSILTF